MLDRTGHFTVVTCSAVSHTAFANRFEKVAPYGGLQYSKPPRHGDKDRFCSLVINSEHFAFSISATSSTNENSFRQRLKYVGWSSPFHGCGVQTRFLLSPVQSREVQRAGAADFRPRHPCEHVGRPAINWGSAACPVVQFRRRFAASSFAAAIPREHSTMPIRPKSTPRRITGCHGSSRHAAGAGITESVFDGSMSIQQG